MWWLWMLAACSLGGSPAGPPLTPDPVTGASPCRPGTGPALTGSYTDKDKGRTQVPVVLTPIAEGCGNITDIQFLPGRDVMLVVEQSGKVFWIDRDEARVGVMLDHPLPNGGERGLLGLAFHPKFADNGTLYVNHTVKPLGSRIVEYALPNADLNQRAAKTRTLLGIDQPFGNHNAGQVQFGPDGMLYIGFGDGGAANDPHGHGQNPQTFLGAMLRIDVDHPTEGREYGIPADNPTVPGWRPELFAIGLRNPWRYSFDPAGRLVVADVGQNKWEEVTIVASGSNHGWNTREAAHCFAPKKGCGTEGLTDPIYEYPRQDGNSITGGYVHTSPAVDGLAGRYVFGDFGSGRIWALDLPADGASRVEAFALGKFPVNISTFGRDHAGRIYVSSYTDGRIYRIDAGS